MTAVKIIKAKTLARNSNNGIKTARDLAGRTDEMQVRVENTRGFPVVSIGASAGGLAAFEAFFSGMPAATEPGMAFVLIQHLAPDHKSILTELIRRCTRMQVFEVEDGMEVMPNCTYIIPPNFDMSFINGRLQLIKPSAPRGRRLPIDFFFRSLAKDQGEKAICIVLSGTGSDGTLGVQAVKGEGGMVMVQNLDSTEYDGMPRSAIATGLVDYELPPSEMAAQLIAYVEHAFGKHPPTVSVPVSKAEDTLKKIFVLLHAQTGHDFSQYKPSTINRRIERRMAVSQIQTIDEYVDLLQQNPSEMESLFHDLLIGVTSFFRDPEAFQALEELVIPKLFAGKPSDGTIRVWSPGCAMGEEAYSLAILLAEYQEAHKQSFKTQVFATDIDGKAIATARTGIYPSGIATDITPARLTRFFAAEAEGSAYRIHKAIRDMLIFSEQDVIKDPPFSKLDLISCRNLLIYISAEQQKKLIQLFHYALNPGGFLFLGTSETVGEFGDRFATIDRKLKLYQRKEDAQGMQRRSMSQCLPSIAAVGAAHLQTTGKATIAGKMSLRELTEQALLQQVAPTGALVNGHGDIFYLHGRTGLYLEPAPGDAGVNNILKMARKGLRHELTMALHQAAGAKEIVSRLGLRVKTNGDFTTANLTICPLAPRPAGPVPGLRTKGSAPAPALEPRLYLVILEEAPGQGGAAGPKGTPLDPAQVQQTTSPADGTDAYIENLMQELRDKEEYLQGANEELKSTNEEMQSINEELQSTIEELETSKEELQSINEELTTVNSELQTKVTDLSRTNNDMNNLLAGTSIATVFVDMRLCILRFTPTATRIINLIFSDVGRPVGHIVSNLVGYDSLVSDVQAVLNTQVPHEVDVQTVEGKWYSLRILPYITLDNVIEGAVITFIDISEVKKIQNDLQKALDDIRTLRGIIPICANCKKIRDDQGYWNQVEVYIRDRTEVEFSHGICPDCARKLYPELEMNNDSAPEGNKKGSGNQG
jgi:two-component system, chemotaxis family, CheB/CheR fusion protein